MKLLEEGKWKISEKEIEDIETRSEQVFLAFANKGGYESISRYCTLAQRIRVKWWAHHLREYNQAYWNMVMMMSFYNLGNPIEAAVEAVADGEKGPIDAVSTVLSLEGYDYAVVKNLYERNMKVK